MNLKLRRKMKITAKSVSKFWASLLDREDAFTFSINRMSCLDGYILFMKFYFLIDSKILRVMSTFSNLFNMYYILEKQSS